MKIILLTFSVILFFEIVSGRYYTIHVNEIVHASDVQLTASFKIQVQDSYSEVYICEFHTNNKQWQDEMAVTAQYNQTSPPYSS